MSERALAISPEMFYPLHTVVVGFLLITSAHALPNRDLGECGRQLRQLTALLGAALRTDRAAEGATTTPLGDPLEQFRAMIQRRVTSADRMLAKAMEIAALQELPAEIITIEDEFPTGPETVETFQRRALRVLPGAPIQLSEDAQELGDKFGVQVIYDPYQFLRGIGAGTFQTNSGSYLAMSGDSFAHLRLGKEKNYESIRLESRRRLSRGIPNRYQVTIHQIQVSAAARAGKWAYDDLPLELIPALMESLNDDPKELAHVLGMLEVARIEIDAILSHAWTISFLHQPLKHTSPDERDSVPIAMVFATGHPPMSFAMLEPELAAQHHRAMGIKEQTTATDRQTHVEYQEIVRAVELRLREKLSELDHLALQLTRHLQQAKSASYTAHRKEAIQKAVTLARESFNKE